MALELVESIFSLDDHIFVKGFYDPYNKNGQFVIPFFDIPTAKLLAETLNNPQDLIGQSYRVERTQSDNGFQVVYLDYSPELELILDTEIVVDGKTFKSNSLFEGFCWVPVPNEDMDNYRGIDGSVYLI